MEMTTLGDLISLQRGYDLTETQRRPGKVPIVGSAGVHGYHDKARAKGPGVALGRSGASFGKVSFVREDYWPHNTTIFVTDFKGNEPVFIRYLLESLDFSSLNSGSAQQSLNRNYVYLVPVMKFPHAVQRRIAGILSAYDELIENNQRRIKILESISRALYREWFVYFRFPGHEKHPRVHSPLGEIPQGWEVRSIHQVAGLVSRGPSLTYLNKGGVPVINQRCIRNDEIEMQAVQYAVPLSEKKSHLYLRPHDVLINSMGVGTLGRVSRNLSIDEPVIIHNCITVVRAKAGEPTSVFLYYRLSDCQEHFESLGVGATGQTSLRIETIEEVQFPLPPVSLLMAFEEVVMPMWNQIGVLKRQIQNLRRTRELLLPRLLSDQIALRDN